MSSIVYQLDSVDEIWLSLIVNQPGGVDMIWCLLFIFCNVVLI